MNAGPPLPSLRSMPERLRGTTPAAGRAAEQVETPWNIDCPLYDNGKSGKKGDEQTPMRASTDDEQAFAHWMRVAVCLHQSGRFGDALPAYRRALQNDPLNHYAQRCLADLLNCLGRYGEALLAYDLALELGADRAPTSLGKADALLKLCRYGEALALCEQAIALAPRAAPAFALKGDLLSRLECEEEACAASTRALTLHPGFAEAYNNLGVLLCQMHHYRGAQRCFQQAMQLEPGPTTAAYNHGLLAALLRAREGGEQASSAAPVPGLQREWTVDLGESVAAWEDLCAPHDPAAAPLLPG